MQIEVTTSLGKNWDEMSDFQEIATKHSVSGFDVL